jgi:daunorubicin resistance ABC transporter ATP-binding subunit
MVVRAMYETMVHNTKTLPTALAGDGPQRRHGVVAEGLGKRFGEHWAVRDLDLEVATGSVLGLLGHNGAGKTTAIRMLTTLSVPTTGHASVAGFDVATQAADVRSRIGVAAQAATVDDLLTSRANLVMVGRLYGLRKSDAAARAEHLLELVDLADAPGLTKTFSGGMRRRLDLAASLVGAPSVLFLDEPTTGLDPLSRMQLWQVVRNLADEGTTIVLTTQYLEEADQLADEIVVLDHGAVVAQGTPAQLKSRIGSELVAITVASEADLQRVDAAVGHLASAPVTLTAEVLQAAIPVGSDVRLMDVVRALDAGGVEVLEIERRGASLDDVFLAVTGTRPTPAATDGDDDQEEAVAGPSESASEVEQHGRPVTCAPMSCRTRRTP